MINNQSSEFIDWDTWEMKNKEGVECHISFRKKKNSIEIAAEDAGIIIRTRGVSETLPGGPERSFHGYGKRSDFAEPIDFIFVSPEFRVLSFRTDATTFGGAYASDHYPVVVKMLLD